jgi:hypothetical protein
MVRPEFRRRFIRAIQLFEVLKSSIGHFLSFSFPFRQSLLPDFRRCSSLNEAVGFAGSVKSLPELIAVMTPAKGGVEYSDCDSQRQILRTSLFAAFEKSRVHCSFPIARPRNPRTKSELRIAALGAPNSFRADEANS